MNHDLLRSSRQVLEAELVSAGGSVRPDNKCRCPYHDNPSLSSNIYEDDGVWRFKCHSCGEGPYDVFDIMAKSQGKPVEDLLRERRAESDSNPPPKRDSFTLAEIEAKLPGEQQGKYVYTDPVTNRRDMIVYRLMMPSGKKEFRQISPNGSPDRFVMKAPPKPLPLYNRTRIQNAKEVIVVEGEKCVHSLQKARIVGTTSPGGAQNAVSADWRPLAGKDVYLWPDNDEAGRAYMEAVAKKLEKLSPAPRVFLIDPAECDLGEKEDVADYLERIPEEDHAIAIAEVLNESEQISVSHVDALSSHFDKAVSGEIKIHPMKYKVLSNLTNALKPQSITLICGEPGSAKSLFLLDHVMFWTEKGIKSCVYELEENRTYHLNRVLAIKAENSALTTEQYIFDNPSKAREALAKHREILSLVSPHIWEVPDLSIDTRKMLDWVSDRINDGYEIICIDPISARDPEDKQWMKDHELVVGIERLLAGTNSRVVLVTHPKQGAKTKNMGDLAGGAVFERLIQTIFWIEKPKRVKDLNCDTGLGCPPFPINRIITLLKTRNGKGAGLRLGYDFSEETFSFMERGIIRS